MTDCTIITTIKNRREHFIKTFPFMLTQYGIPYEIVLVNYYSNDDLSELIESKISSLRDTFSPFLRRIREIELLEDLKFNPRKARNLGAAYCKKNTILSFSDVDVFLGMTYTSHWCKKVMKEKAFVATRRQDTKAYSPGRLSPEINYGNFRNHRNGLRHGRCIS